MEHCGEERLCDILCNLKWRHYLEDVEILLKSDAKSLQKFLAGRIDNVKLNRWFLELQGRNIQVEHIPGHKNKAASCLSWLPFATRKRNDNQLKDEDVSIHETKVEVGEDCCFLCEVDLTDTKALQQSDKHCIRIAKLTEDPRSRFHKSDSYGCDDDGLLYQMKLLLVLTGKDAGLQISAAGHRYTRESFCKGFC